MIKLIEGDEKSGKLDVLKDLLAASKESMKGKLPKGKAGVSVMSVSVKSKKPDEHSHDEALKEGARMSGMDNFLPGMNDEKGMELEREKLGETEEQHNEEQHSEDDGHTLQNPKIPQELLELCKKMLKR